MLSRHCLSADVDYVESDRTDSLWAWIDWFSVPQMLPAPIPGVLAGIDLSLRRLLSVSV